MEDRKVLIITYYWPPSGGSGVQRWLKFVKYLPQFEWTPYVFTPENPSFAQRDESLLKDVPAEAEVIQFPIWEPYGLAGRKAGHQVAAKEKQSWLGKITTWMRGNLIYPDPRVFWVRPSVKFLNDFILENKIFTVITTGPPHSMHLIGYRLKKKNSTLRWIADFRDPWSEWGLLDSLRATAVSKSIHRWLERKVLTSADHVVTITPFYVRQFERLSGRKVKLLSNGFDETDFAGFSLKRPEVFTIRHIGTVNEKCNPCPFMEAFVDWYQANPALKNKVVIEFVGDVYPGFKKFVADNAVMQSVTRFVEPVPHGQLMEIYATSSLLLLVLHGYKDAEGYMPGKLFEYMATGLPILGVGPVNGDAAEALKISGAGEMIKADDPERIINLLDTLYRQWVEGRSSEVNSNISKYSRKAITEALTHLLK
jgi:glycosyltransferase involved in cell wall biosynthesis